MGSLSHEHDIPSLQCLQCATHYNGHNLPLITQRHRYLQSSAELSGTSMSSIRFQYKVFPFLLCSLCHLGRLSDHRAPRAGIGSEQSPFLESNPKPSSSPLKLKDIIFFSFTFQGQKLRPILRETNAPHEVTRRRHGLPKNPIPLQFNPWQR